MVLLLGTSADNQQKTLDKDMLGGGRPSLFCFGRSMSTKLEKKQLLKSDIITAANIYKEKLAGKVFLYVYGREYFELNFATAQFLHLTGVATNLRAREFYRRAKDSTLALNQFYFCEGHPFATAKRKLQCLKNLPSLTTELVCVLKGLNTLTFILSIQGSENGHL